MDDAESNSQFVFYISPLVGMVGLHDLLSEIVPLAMVIAVMGTLNDVSKSGRAVWWVLIGAVILVGLGLAAFWLFRPIDPDALRSSDWRTFKARFVDENGRVVDTGNGGISHSEGQGYTMLFAVAFDDRETFARIWDWTRTNLQRPDDLLFSWKWSPEDGGHIADPNNASDGDLLIAWALVRAHALWENYEYLRAAAQIVAASMDGDQIETRLGLQLLPGRVGFVRENETILNPSYYIFPAFSELAAAFPSETWDKLTEGGKQLIREARFGKWNLSPDWVTVLPDALKAGKPEGAEFGYNAIRVPLHVAWFDPNSDLLQPFAAFWQELESEGAEIPAVVNVDDNAFGPYPALPGMLAVVAFTEACVSGQPLSVAEIPKLDDEEPYYSASLKLLTTLAAHELAKERTREASENSPEDP